MYRENTHNKDCEDSCWLNIQSLHKHKGGSLLIVDDVEVGWGRTVLEEACTSLDGLGAAVVPNSNSVAKALW